MRLGLRQLRSMLHFMLKVENKETFLSSKIPNFVMLAIHFVAAEDVK
jgi:hypothetical protein